MVKQKANSNHLALPEEVWKHHQDSFVSLMKKWKKNKKVSPVLLLTGPQGVGKRSTVTYLSRWLLCEQNGIYNSQALSLFNTPQELKKNEESFYPCENCPSCQRALHGNWVDFNEIKPSTDANGKQTTIKLEQLKEIQTTQHRGGHEGKLRIFLINDANKMSLQAANSLLKTLEEPPQGWIFFLTATDGSLLLPTLLSRCQRLRLKPFSQTQIKELLKSSSLSEEKIELCSKLAQGSWKKAVFLVEENNWKQRELIFSFLRNPGKELMPLIDWASKTSQNFTFLLDQLEQIVTDLIHWSVHQETHPKTSYQWVSSDGQSSLTEYVKNKIKSQTPIEAREFWFECCEKISYTRKTQNAPLNRKLLIQDLLFPWLEQSNG